MTGDESEAQAPRIHKWIGVVGLFVAPTTVITALCFYFGYHYLNRYFDFFGIESNTLGFATSDYVLGSVRPLFLPIIVLLSAWILALWVGQLLSHLVRSGRHSRPVRITAWTAITVGAIGITRGVVGMTVADYDLDHITTLTPVGLGFGSALVIGGFWLLAVSKNRETSREFAVTGRASMVVAAAAVVLALFWLTGIYAGFRGEEDAEHIAAQLWARETSVVLDTTHRLAAPEDLIVETRLPDNDPRAATTYRYECFRALSVRGDTWILLPAGWRVEHGYALMVKSGPDNRLSMNKQLGITKTAAFDRTGGWQCPEVAPKEALVTQER